MSTLLGHAANPRIDVVVIPASMNATVGSHGFIMFDRESVVAGTISAEPTTALPSDIAVNDDVVAMPAGPAGAAAPQSTSPPTSPPAMLAVGSSTRPDELAGRQGVLGGEPETAVLPPYPVVKAQKKRTTSGRLLCWRLRKSTSGRLSGFPDGR